MQLSKQLYLWKTMCPVECIVVYWH